MALSYEVLDTFTSPKLKQPKKGGGGDGSTAYKSYKSCQ